jgi:hypothetical protein
MRIIVFTVFLTILVVGFAWYSMEYLQVSSGKIIQQLDALEKQISDENWHEAQQSLAGIAAYWNEIHKNWKLLIDHRETDEIEIAITRLKSAFHAKEQGDALAELAVLRFYLEHIPAKERVLLRNIF